MDSRPRATTEGHHFTGDAYDWITPFSLFVGAALVSGYALIGSTWLILKTEGDLQEWAYAVARRLVWVVSLAIVIISAWIPLQGARIAARWFNWPNIAYFSPVPILTALVMYGLLRSLGTRREAAPFILTIVLFGLAYCGFIVSLWPYVVPPAIMIYEAAAAPNSQLFLLVGVAFLIPLILAYTSFSYFVFRGKVRPEEGHH